MSKTRFAPKFLLAATLAMCAMSASATLVPDSLALPSASEAPVLSLNTVTREQVEPDEMRIQLAVERQGFNLGQLNSEVLTAVNKALATLKREDPAVTAVVHQLYTSPMTVEGSSVKNWSVRAVLQLSGSNFDSVSKAASKLATNMEMVNLGFELSDAKRAEVMASMYDEAGKQYHAKAKALGKALGYSDYKVLTVGVHESGGGGGPMPRMAMMKTMADASVPTQPAKVEVSVQMSGTVALHK